MKGEKRKLGVLKFIIVIYALFCIIVFAVTMTAQENLNEQQNVTQTKQIAGLLAEKMNASFAYVIGYAKEYALTLEQRQNEDLPTFYEEQQKMIRDTEYSGLGLVGPDGTVYGEEGQVADLKKYGYIDDAIKTKEQYITEPYRSCVSGDHILTVFLPFDRGEGQQALLFASFQLKSLQDVADTSVLEDQAGIFLLNAYSGNHISCVEWQSIMPGSWRSLKLEKSKMRFQEGYSYDRFVQSMRSGDEDGIIIVDQDGTTYMVAYEKIESMPDWYMVIKMESEQLLDESLKVQRYIWFGSAAMVLATALMVWYLFKREEREKRRFRQLSTIDMLTNVYNRREFDHCLDLYVASDEENKCGMLLFFDLDEFKKINDTYGHKSGDHILRTFAGILQSICAGGSVVGRFGGDEFVVFLKGCTEKSVVRRFVQDIREQAFCEMAKGERLRISFSVGAALYPTDAVDLDELCNCADQAVYKAKQSGKDTLVFYDETT